jgi:hypothetical protein
MVWLGPRGAIPRRQSSGAPFARRRKRGCTHECLRFEEQWLLRLILKSWVPADGTGSQACRHATVSPGVVLPRGTHLTFHMDHAGVPVDAEMQLTLGYIPAPGRG